VLLLSPFSCSARATAVSIALRINSSCIALLSFIGSSYARYSTPAAALELLSFILDQNSGGGLQFRGFRFMPSPAASDVHPGTDAQDNTSVRVSSVVHAVSDRMYELTYRMAGFTSGFRMTPTHLITVKCIMNLYVYVSLAGADSNYHTMVVSWFDRYSLQLQSKALSLSATWRGTSDQGGDRSSASTHGGRSDRSRIGRRR
jgi:hypothetical protein